MAVLFVSRSRATASEQEDSTSSRRAAEYTGATVASTGLSFPEKKSGTCIHSRRFPARDSESRARFNLKLKSSGPPAVKLAAVLPESCQRLALPQSVACRKWHNCGVRKGM